MKRVLLKLSGEALAGEKKTGFDEATVSGIAGQVKALTEKGIQIAVVTGGGNFWPACGCAATAFVAVTAGSVLINAATF